MCSRYSLTSPAEAVRQLFAIGHDFPLVAREQIRPTEPALIIKLDETGRREARLVRWGLLPPWVKDPRQFSTLINARAETVLEKPSFRGAIRHKRCLVPADGFYEWSGGPRDKTPHFIRPKARNLMAFAGLSEHWLGADGSEIETMAILTVAANATVGAIHDRMPAILAPDVFELWLNTRETKATDAAHLLLPASDDLLDMVVLPRAMFRSPRPAVERAAKAEGAAHSSTHATRENLADTDEDQPKLL